MLDSYRNIYKAARVSAGLTQERAAEMLGVSVESIRAYETSLRTPPDETVENMVICYNAQFLAYQHLRASAAMARAIMPEVRESSLAEAAVRLVSRVFGFSDDHRDRQLLRIAEDNIVDQRERAEFEAILEELDDIVEAAIALRYAQGKDV